MSFQDHSPPRMYTEQGFSEYRQQRIETLQDRMRHHLTPVNIVPPHAGVYHTDVAEPIINFVDCQNEHIMRNKNAYIVLGSDRPSDETSGYGRAGAQRASSIDLVVGRLAAINSGIGPEDGAMVHNSFGADAARIVMSQTTDIDTNFAIADGTLGNIKGRSGIGIKADSVRIIGREGIKIVTGKAPFKNFGIHGETNSRGGTIIPAPKIELIAGNSTQPTIITGGPLGLVDSVSALQPIVMGENLMSAMQALADVVEGIWSALFNMSIIQNSFNGILSADIIHPHKPAAFPVAANQVIENVMKSLWATRIDSLMWELNHLEPYGYRYICSRNVTTT